MSHSQADLNTLERLERHPPPRRPGRFRWGEVVGFSVAIVVLSLLALAIFSWLGWNLQKHMNLSGDLQVQGSTQFHGPVVIRNTDRESGDNSTLHTTLLPSPRQTSSLTLGCIRQLGSSASLTAGAVVVVGVDGESLVAAPISEQAAPWVNPELYVSSSILGNDNNSGKTRISPLRSVQAALRTLSALGSETRTVPWTGTARVLLLGTSYTPQDGENTWETQMGGKRVIIESDGGMVQIGEQFTTTGPAVRRPGSGLVELPVPAALGPRVGSFVSWENREPTAIVSATATSVLLAENVVLLPPIGTLVSMLDCACSVNLVRSPTLDPFVILGGLNDTVRLSSLSFVPNAPDQMLILDGNEIECGRGVTFWASNSLVPGATLTQVLCVARSISVRRTRIRSPDPATSPLALSFGKSCQIARIRNSAFERAVVSIDTERGLLAEVLLGAPAESGDSGCHLQMGQQHPTWTSMTQVETLGTTAESCLSVMDGANIQGSQCSFYAVGPNATLDVGNGSQVNISRGRWEGSSLASVANNSSVQWNRPVLGSTPGAGDVLATLTGASELSVINGHFGSGANTPSIDFGGTVGVHALDPQASTAVQPMISAVTSATVTKVVYSTLG